MKLPPVMSSFNIMGMRDVCLEGSDDEVVRLLRNEMKWGWLDPLCSLTIWLIAKLNMESPIKSTRPLDTCILHTSATPSIFFLSKATPRLLLFPGPLSSTWKCQSMTRGQNVKSRGEREIWYSFIQVVIYMLFLEWKLVWRFCFV